MEKYTVEYFIAKFSKIPEEDFCVNALVKRSPEGREQRCFIGHCFPGASEFEMGQILMLDDERNQENMATSRMFMYYGMCRMNINNGDDPCYQQPTPKQRILAALRDIQAMDADVRDLQKKELVQN